MWMIIIYVLNTFDDVSSSEKARVLNMAQLYIRGIRRVLNMSDYGSIGLRNS